MFQHAGAGYGGQGTLCGSLGACSALINLVTFDGKNTHNMMIGDLINWYASFNHPPDEFDSIAHYPKQKRIVPGSPLCHISVSTWAVANGVKISTYEKKDRCAKVAGKVAMQTVTMLNAYVAGKWHPVAPGVSEKTGTCLECHGPGGDHNEQGRMECGLCHDKAPDHAG